MSQDSVTIEPSGGPQESPATSAAPSATRRRAIRLALVAWVLFVGHFATNVEREHYVAFALVDDQSLKVDDYLGLHPDIFEHTDGHSYVGNNVGSGLPGGGAPVRIRPGVGRLRGEGQGTKGCPGTGRRTRIPHLRPSPQSKSVLREGDCKRDSSFGLGAPQL